jgi:hypothetical protein
LVSNMTFGVIALASIHLIFGFMYGLDMKLTRWVSFQEIGRQAIFF